MAGGYKLALGYDLAVFPLYVLRAASWMNQFFFLLLSSGLNRGDAERFHRF